MKKNVTIKLTNYQATDLGHILANRKARLVERMEKAEGVFKGNLRDQIARVDEITHEVNKVI